jgi:hypothetical protein
MPSAPDTLRARIARIEGHSFAAKGAVSPYASTAGPSGDAQTNSNTAVGFYSAANGGFSEAFGSGAEATGAGAVAIGSDALVRRLGGDSIAATKLKAPHNGGAFLLRCRGGDVIPAVSL